MSTFGMFSSFPVKDTDITVPWGMLEPHRAEIQKAHGKPLEWLATHGGLARDDLVKIIGEAAIQTQEAKP